MLDYQGFYGDGGNRTRERFLPIIVVLLAAVVFVASASANTLKIISIPKAPASVLTVARDAQASVCASVGVCVTARAPSPNCLPLNHGIESWVCQGAVRVSTAKGQFSCAVDTFSSPEGGRHRVRMACRQLGGSA